MKGLEPSLVENMRRRSVGGFCPFFNSNNIKIILSIQTESITLITVLMSGVVPTINAYTVQQIVSATVRL